jgi:hypothetical protein
MSRRPLLFLDVDGPLNPYAAQPERRPEGYTTIRVPAPELPYVDFGTGVFAERNRARTTRCS